MRDEQHVSFHLCLTSHQVAGRITTFSPTARSFWGSPVAAHHD